MPKLSQKEGGKKSLAQGFFIAEEKVLFEFLDWEIKKRHFYSIVSIIFTLSLSLFFIKKLHSNNQELSSLVVLILFIISITIVSLIVKVRLARDGVKVNALEVSKRVVPLYTIALLFVLAYVILNVLLGDGLLSFKEAVFLLSFATVFETITFHVH